MDLFTAIDTRASAARLEAPGPNRDQLARLLSAAVRAPDHGRLAPWHFLVLEAEARERLGAAMREARREKNPQLPDEDLQREHDKALRAPTIIVASAKLTDAGDKVPAIEQIVAVGAAVQNLLLAAHTLGYGTMWKTGPAAYDNGVKAALGLDADEAIVGFIYIGTTAAAGTIRPAALDGKVRWL